MARPVSLNLGIGAGRDIDTISNLSHLSTRNYAVTAPYEADPMEVAMHDFLDSIDV